jgi:hypothetical protein
MVLTLLYIPEDISKLTVLTSLNSLSIKRGIYDRYSLSIAFQGMGHRLVELVMDHVENVDIVHIIKFCSCLETLKF